MRLFISAGEPSGDIHGANLSRAIQRLDPSADLFGLGGGRMRDAGVELIYPLAEHAIMGFFGVIKVVPELDDLLNRVTALWHRRRPDAVVLIDYPGFHWHVAARARALEIPVVSFVPPQIWGWASYRVRRMRKNFDHVLCSLPFEEEWFSARGVKHVRYIGHPFFDDLAERKLDVDFISSVRTSGPIVALLPGSRNHEVHDNYQSLIGAARIIHQARPDAQLVVAAFRDKHRSEIESKLSHESLPIKVFVGRTPEIIAAADACIAVSGSVGLELLYYRIPTVVVYRTTPFHMFLVRCLKNVRYISIVNLLANRELYPECLGSRVEASGPAQHILNWLNDSVKRVSVVEELDKLCDRVARPGACTTAAEFLFDRFGKPRSVAA